MTAINPGGISRFEEFRNPHLAETLADCIEEVKTYLPTSSAAILERPSDPTESCFCLAGKLPDSPAVTPNLTEALRGNFSAGRHITAGNVIVLPIIVFGHADHFLALDTSAVKEQAAIPSRVGIFAIRISTVLESHVTQHRMFEFGKRHFMTEMNEVVRHELRGRCSVIRESLARLLLIRRGNQTKEMTEIVKTIDDHIADILKSIDLLRSEARMSMRLCSIEEIVERVGSIFLSGRRSRITFLSALDQEYRGHAISEVASHILLNLLFNSLEASENVVPPKGETPSITVAVGASEQPGCIAITITDSGCGIRPENRERIFEAFFTTRPDKAGLGLTISRKLAEGAGGSLRLLDTGWGRGTTFVLTLPAKPRDHEDP